LSGLLIEQWGWRAIFLGTAVLAGLSLMLAAPTLRESRDSPGTDAWTRPAC